MLDFMFFSDDLAVKFAQQATDLGAVAIIEAVESGEADADGVQVRVKQAGLSDEQLDTLDALYDELFFIEQAELIEEGGSQADACGVQIQLASGEFTNVLMPPEEMNRLLSIFSPSEVQSLFARIADAVENPQNHQCSVCHVIGRQQVA